MQLTMDLLCLCVFDMVCNMLVQIVLFSELGTKSCDRSNSRAGAVPGGGLYSMISTSFSKFFQR